jgi:hypothetical protein
MLQIRSFGVFQTSKVMGALYFVVGLIMGLFGFFFGLLTGRFLHALFMLIMMPIGYGVAGFIFTAILCALYNELAGRIGGIEVERF